MAKKSNRGTISVPGADKMGGSEAPQKNPARVEATPTPKPAKRGTLEVPPETPQVQEPTPRLDSEVFKPVDALADAEEFFRQAESEDNDAPEPKVVDEQSQESDDTFDPLEAIMPKKEEEKPEVVDEKDDVLDELTPPTNEEAKAGWNELKAIAKTARDENAALKAKIEELTQNRVDPNSKAVVDQQVQELQEQNKMMSERLKTLDLANHPEFQREFVIPQKRIVEDITQALEGTDHSEAIVASLDLPQREFARAISDAGSDLDEFTKTRLFNLAMEYRNVAAKAKNALENVDQSVESYQKQSMQHAKQVFDSVSQDYVNGQYFRPQEIPEDAPENVKASLTQYNEAYSNIKQEAENLAFGQVDEKAVAQMAHEASLFKFILKHGLPRLANVMTTEVQRRDSRIKELESQVASIRSNKPKPSYSGGDTGGGDGNMSIEQMSAEAAASQISFQ